MKNKILPVFISFYGCRQRCVYCNQYSITGLKHKEILTSAQEQIESYLKISDGWTELAYYGGSFTCLPESTQKSLYDLAHSKGISKLRFSTSPDCITDGNMELAVENGVETVEIGVQSLDDKVLSMNRRPCTAEDTIKAMLCAKKHVKHLAAQIMTGMYGEEFGSLDVTLDKIIGISPEYVRIYPCVVLNDTELETIYKNGGYTPLTLAQSMARTAYAMIRLEAEGIKVIRAGLQDAAQMKESIAAGAYHPATGDIIKTIAVAIALSLGHNIETDRKRLNEAYGYGSYNKEACEGRITIKDGAAIDTGAIAKKISETWVEDYKRNLERETAFHAERLVGASHNG